MQPLPRRIHQRTLLASIEIPRQSLAATLLLSVTRATLESRRAAIRKPVSRAPRLLTQLPTDHAWLFENSPRRHLEQTLRMPLTDHNRRLRGFPRKRVSQQHRRSTTNPARLLHKLARRTHRLFHSNLGSKSHENLTSENGRGEGLFLKRPRGNPPPLSSRPPGGKEDPPTVRPQQGSRSRER
mgnify:CR=1 FL=1